VSFKYRIGKTIKWEAAHQLKGLPDDHPCTRLHGHSYSADIVLRSDFLDETGFVLDYNVLKTIKNMLDHQNLNEILEENPTAENIAAFIFSVVTDILRRMEAEAEVFVELVRVRETETTWAEVTASRPAQ
jgi:6-pyruvoyltetrahydropterin/6-carboxytetrahydropterin synthase